VKRIRRHFPQRHGDILAKMLALRSSRLRELLTSLIKAHRKKSGGEKSGDRGGRSPFETIPYRKKQKYNFRIVTAVV
jgi:hypothetical protein